MLLYIVAVSDVLAGEDPCNPTNVFFGIPYRIGVLHDISNVPQSPCASMSNYEAWYDITTSNTAELYVNLIAIDNSYGGLALYTGDCASPVLVDCVEDDLCGSSQEIFTHFTDLIPNQKYYLRIWTTEANQDNRFSLQVKDGYVKATDFDLVGDASITQFNEADCIQITPEENAQRGCAWLGNTISFAQPFRHDMYVYLGTKDDNGADGICLVYQNSLPNPCGDVGGGIGAQGILNSIIIEFDTWQNDDLGDPRQDHIALNLNGNMNHNSSLELPVSAGNLEDGEVHRVSFTWQPLSMEYVFELDNQELFRGNYDFVNLVFGGNSDVYWGYTASTGGFSNQQYVCPEIFNVHRGSRDTLDVAICRGDSYFAGGGLQTETGVYEDVFPLTTGCDSIIITRLEVSDSIITVLDTSICQGGCVTFFNQSICNPGSYTFSLRPAAACDSFVRVRVDEFQVDLEFSDSAATINCDRPEISLGVQALNTNFNPMYSWQHAGQVLSGQNIQTSSAGRYEVFARFDYFGQGCSTDTIEIVVPIDTAAPDVQFAPVTLDCTDNAYAFEFEDSRYSSSLFDPSGQEILGMPPLISTAGMYVVQLKNTSNGCTANSNLVIQNPMPPEITSFMLDSITCTEPGAILIESVEGGTAPFIYGANTDMLSNSNYLTPLKVGQNTIVVMDQEACTDTLVFTLNLPDEISVAVESPIHLEEGDSAVLQSMVFGPNVEQTNYSWVPAAALSCTDCPAPTFNGFRSMNYTLFVQNEQGCRDSAEVQIIVRADSLLYVPNAISPNDDGVNERLLIYAKNKRNFFVEHYRIYNRWGDLVYEVEDMPLAAFDPFGWDGTMNGNALEPGVYAYSIQLRSFSDRTYQLQGNITLIK